MTDQMFSETSAGPPSGRHRVVLVVDGRLSYFQLIEPDVRDGDGVEAWRGGLLKIRRSRVRCLTGGRMADSSVAVASVEVQVSAEAPECLLEEYDDVVEESYHSSYGLLTVVDWQDHLVHALPALPAGPGPYRLRYHLRHQATDRVGEYLLQIWPAEMSPPEALKITTSLAGFWHPKARS